MTPGPARTRRTLAAVVLAGTVLAPLGLGAAPDARAAAPRAADPVRRELTVPVGAEPDGTKVSLDVTLVTPVPDDAPTRHPAVILAHGFGGSKADLLPRADDLARQGYVVLAYTARGFGASGGRIHLDDPDYEIADGRALVDLLATRPDVQLDKAGDPRVGVAGASYGGALALMLAASDPRVDADVAAITWNDLGTALAPDGVLKLSWISLLFQSAMRPSAGGGQTSAASSPAVPATGAATRQSLADTVRCGRFDPTLCRQILDATASGNVPAALRAELTRHSPAPLLRTLKAPTLLVQGMTDSLFGIDQAIATTKALAGRGRPFASRWYDGGHGSSAAAPSDAETLGPWFDRYLRGNDQAPWVSGFTAPAPAFTRGGQNRTLVARALPGTDRQPAPEQTVALRPTNGSPTAALISPPGGQPQATLGGIGGIGGIGATAGSGGGSGAGSSQGTSGGFSGGDTSGGGAGGSGASGGAGGSGGAGDGSGSSGSGGSSGGANSAAASALAGIAGYRLAALPGQSVAYDTVPTDSAVTVVGAPRVEVTVTSTAADTTLFATLWRVNGSGADQPRPLVAPVRVTGTPGKPHKVAIDLPAGIYSLDPGSTWRVLLSTTATGYAVPRDFRTYAVTLSDARLHLPVWQQGAAGAAETDPGRDREVLGLLAAIAGVLGLIVIGALLGRRRAVRRQAPSLAGQRAGQAGPSARKAAPSGEPGVASSTAADAQPVLAVEGLTKRYRTARRSPLQRLRGLLRARQAGEAAPGVLTVVDGVSWQAWPGQVVGLLGPNGAGKTTTMRMIVGLIQPDAGSVHIRGQLMAPGAPALREVGALIEGPGFLPHLSGRANLAAYWRATGRPASEARTEDALAVAGLGSAVDRAVGTYSQGMRQRLGIAQAMLGMPDLLLLDEPANGLDPPQIAAMRQVLRDYAATGRTVVVSSHLLAEVEATCTDVVVMQRGKVVLTGPIGTVTEDADTTAVTLATPLTDRTRTLLTGRGWTVEPTAFGGGRHQYVIHAPGAPRTEVLRALIESGADILEASGHRPLEDVFLSLVAGGSDTSDGSAGASA